MFTDPALMDWSAVGNALSGAAAVGVPLVIAAFRLHGRVVRLETWKEALTDRLDGFESRVLAALTRIEDKLDRKVDR
jgi:hypothetical protein